MIIPAHDRLERHVPGDEFRERPCPGSEIPGRAVDCEGLQSFSAAWFCQACSYAVVELRAPLDFVTMRGWVKV